MQLADVLGDAQLDFAAKIEKALARIGLNLRGDRLRSFIQRVGEILPLGVGEIGMCLEHALWIGDDIACRNAQRQRLAVTVQ